MNWPFLIGTQANNPSPDFDRPIRRCRDCINFAGMRLICGRTERPIASSMQTYDVAIIGAGHNGLTCAAYLGMAGLSVKVLERRAVVGGAAVTEEFHPGFRNSVAAYTVSLLNPKIIADLRLSDHGLKIVERRAQNFLPAPDGSFLLTGEGRTRASVARLSAHDAEAIEGFSQELEGIADVLRQFVLRAPPNLVEGFGIGAMSEAFNALGTANILRRLSLEPQRAL